MNVCLQKAVATKLLQDNIGIGKDEGYVATVGFFRNLLTINMKILNIRIPGTRILQDFLVWA